MEALSSSTLSDKAAQLFKDKNFGFLATLMEDGSPQISPVWVDVEGGTIIVNTAMGRVKQKNLGRDTRVGISVADHANPYKMVTVRGRVVEQTHNGADAHIDRMAKKYLGQDRYPGRAPGEKRVLLKIMPEKVYYVSP